MFDYPLFEMPVLGQRMLFALDAVLHVLVSHGAAVGASIVLATANWYAMRTKDQQFDELVYKLLMAFFIVSTAIGALTGIGIWMHANIINPPAIGSLLRVFFWKWFVEWIVFNLEMVLLLLLVPQVEGVERREEEVQRAHRHRLRRLLLAHHGHHHRHPRVHDDTRRLAERRSSRPRPNYLASLFNPSWLPSLAFRTLRGHRPLDRLHSLLHLVFTRQDARAARAGLQALLEVPLRVDRPRSPRRLLVLPAVPTPGQGAVSPGAHDDSQYLGYRTSR